MSMFVSRRVVELRMFVCCQCGDVVAWRSYVICHCPRWHWR